MFDLENWRVSLAACALAQITRVESARKMDVDIEVRRLAAHKIAKRQRSRHLDQQKIASDRRLKTGVCRRPRNVKLQTEFFARRG